MIAHLETIEVNGKHYLTELAYVIGARSPKKSVAYFFINHPGAEQVDLLFTNMDPEYKPPVRYSVRPPMSVFLKDHNKFSPDNTCYVLKSQIPFFDGYMSIALPHLYPEHTPRFEPLEDHFEPQAINVILGEFRAARQKALDA